MNSTINPLRLRVRSLRSFDESKSRTNSELTVIASCFLRDLYNAIPSNSSASLLCLSGNMIYVKLHNSRLVSHANVWLCWYHSSVSRFCMRARKKTSARLCKTGDRIVRVLIILLWVFLCKADVWYYESLGTFPVLVNKGLWMDIYGFSEWLCCPKFWTCISEVFIVA